MTAIALVLVACSLIMWMGLVLWGRAVLGVLDAQHQELVKQTAYLEELIDAEESQG